MTQSDKRRLLGSTGIVGGFTLLSRILGVVRDAVIGYHFGTSVINDIFQMAFEIPNFLRRVLGEGALSAFIVPVFSGVRKDESNREAWRFVNNAFNVFCCITLAVTLVFVLFPQPLFFLYGGAAYLQEGNQQAFALGSRLTRIMFPFLMFLTLTSILMGVLHALQHFLAPSLGSIVLNLAMIAAGTIFYIKDQEQMAVAFAVAVLVGAVVRLLILLPPLWTRGWRWSPRFDFSDPALTELVRKMLPAFFGLAIYQINIMVNLQLANWLGTGCVTYLRYSNRLVQFPLAIFATALSTAILPQLTEFVLAKNTDRLRRHVSFSVRLLSLVYIPSTVGLIVLGEPILRILFERGEWGIESTRNTQFALAMYALGLLPVGLLRILTPVYYAQKDMISPVKYGAFTVALNTALCIVLMLTPLNFAGLALASSLSSVFNAWLLFRGRHRMLGPFWTGADLRTMLIALVAALVMGGTCYAGFKGTMSYFQIERAELLPMIAATLGWVVIGAAVYGGLCFASGMDEAKEIATRLAKFWRKG